MDCDMFAHVTTQENLATLRRHGVEIIDSPEGELASGLCGKGRMAEPEQIVAFVEQLLSEKKKSNLAGRHFVVTAGATIEAIDPVRYITNHSTGRMGYAIAASLAARGAKVTLVSGRTSLPTPQGVERVDVLSAEQMYEQCVHHFASADGAVMCAAVADYTPEEVATHKIKKSDDDMCIRLRRTKDIAAALGAKKGNRVMVGFALESDEGVESAESKLRRKGFDFIVLNSLLDKGAGFGVDTNKVTFIDAAGHEQLPLMPKSEVAERIADRIEQIISHK
jgi:phosphopantothenoylcysteine decarboxylase/phosphopantothenate--cysteine ligase